LNMRTNVRVEVGGTTKLWSEWAAQLGTCTPVMDYRLKILGTREAAIQSIMDMPPRGRGGRGNVQKYKGSMGL
jgi:hypothetical protein